jgi:UDP-glucose 4-epimerase
LKNYLVTGGAGFIGAYLVRKLVEDGHNVTVFENLSRGLMNRLEKYSDKINFIHGDIRHLAEISRAMKGIDVVYHLAAVNGTENFYKHPKLVLDVGIKGIMNVMEAASSHQIAHVIVASSAEVYQTPLIIPTDENEALKLPDPRQARYSYASSKIATETIAINFGRELKRVQLFRPHNIYGPDMGWKHVIPNLIQKINKIKLGDEKDLEILGSGKQTRAFCYVDDVINGLQILEENGAHLEVYHIGSEHELSINELANKICKLMDVAPTFITSNGPQGETLRRCPNISKMRKMGFSPSISIDQGLKNTLDWYLENPISQTENSLL